MQMHILTLESTGKYGSAAITDENNKCVFASSSEEMNHLKDIIMLIDSCLRQAGIEKEDLTHVAASIGPGSFTGIRIGVSTARSIAQTMDIPCIAVPTLEGLAALDAWNEGVDADYICTIINARRNQTYGAVWKREITDAPDAAPVYTDVLEQKQYMIDELLDAIAKLDGKTVFYGDGADAYLDMIQEKLTEGSYTIALEEYRYQRADAAAKVALAKALNGEFLTYDTLLPDYMRRSEAEMRLENGTLSEKISQ